MNELRKLVAMEKLITLGISEYCNIREFGKTKNEGIEDLNDTITVLKAAID